MSDIAYDAESKEKIRLVGESLLGTCHSADTEIENHFGECIGLMDLPIELLHDLDGIAMECTVCGWWFEPGELHGDNDQMCAECDPADDE